MVGAGAGLRSAAANYQLPIILRVQTNYHLIKLVRDGYWGEGGNTGQHCSTQLQFLPSRGHAPARAASPAHQYQYNNTLQQQPPCPGVIVHAMLVTSQAAPGWAILISRWMSQSIYPRSDQAHYTTKDHCSPGPLQLAGLD